MPRNEHLVLCGGSVGPQKGSVPSLSVSMHGTSPNLRLQITDISRRRIFDLHRRHAAAVCRVFDEAISSCAAALRQGTLPSACLLSLVVGQRDGESAYPKRSRVLEQAVSIGAGIRLAIDEVQKRVILDRWGEITGVSAELIVALAEPFRRAMRDELAPEHYPFIETSELMRRIKCNAHETLRRRVLRCRDKIVGLATNAGDPAPSLDAVIENSQSHGYRLKPGSHQDRGAL